MGNNQSSSDAKQKQNNNIKKKFPLTQKQFL